MIFKISYKKLAILLLPVNLRKARIITLLSSLIIAIENIYYNFTGSRNERNRRIRYTPQVCVLEGLLNDEADKQLRRIQIYDRQFSSFINFFYPENGTYNYVITPFLFVGEAAIQEESVYFIVSVPWTAATNEDVERRVRWLLNNYKLAGKKYIIQYN